MTRRRSRATLLGALVSLALIGCSTEAPTIGPASLVPTAGATASSPGTSPEPSPAASGGPTDAPDCATATLNSMTLEQRIGQLLMVKLPGNAVTAEVRDAVATWHIGNAWLGRSTVGVAGTRRQTDALQALATADATANVGFLISANQEGGGIQGLSGPGFDTIPSAVTQGTLSIDDLESRAAVWGGQLADAGVNTNFAPVADVVPAGTEDQNAPIGQLRREYGHDPDTVSSHVAAFIAGMQEGGVAPTAKHFPGLGRVVGNTDNTAEVVDSVTTIDDRYLAPFSAAIDGQTPFVMVALATYSKIDPKNIAAFSSTIMRDLLRDDLGFGGVIMSDSLSATAVTFMTPGLRAIRFLQAGGDLIVLTPISQARAMIRAMVARAGTDAAFRALVDDAALLVLEAKDDAGLLPCS